MLKVNYKKINIKADILAVDKPQGWTSHDVTAKIRGELRKIYGEKIKVGHGGTLDPLATGLLLVLVGKTVKRFEEIKGWDKEYVMEIELGKTTDTGDSEGRVVKETISTSKVEIGQVKKAVGSFLGGYNQQIPMYSAKKVKGKKLYQLARKGKKIKLLRKKIQINQIEVLDLQGRSLQVRVVCGSGTFMRQLAIDIGQKLGTLAYTKNLRRIRVGQYQLN